MIVVKEYGSFLVAMATHSAVRSCVMFVQHPLSWFVYWRWLLNTISLLLAVALPSVLPADGLSTFDVCHLPVIALGAIIVDM